MYATPEQLADANLAQELAQVCTPTSLPPISEALMEATLRGTDRTGTPAEDLLSADAALRTIETALRNADAIIDGYLRARKPVPYVVPIDPVPEQVSVWARWIARYLLHKDLAGTSDQQHPIVRDYKEATRYLQLVADGKFSLGPQDPLPPATNGVPPQVEAAERTFTRESLCDFGT